MELVGKIYQMWKPDVRKGVYFHELQGFKCALVEDGFRWTESSANSKVVIHDGGDILSNDLYKVGELDGNQVYVFGSHRLEDFLENYDR